MVDIAIRLCKNANIPCLLLCDTAHEFHRESAETLVFDKGADSVDFAIANRIISGDIVITQDYGLASMCLARGAKVIHQDGWAYTDINIDALLLARHNAQKVRASGGRLKGQKKRSESQNSAFEAFLTHVLQNTDQG